MRRALVAVVLVTAGLVAATSSSAHQSPHCKMPDHLAVVATTGSGGDVATVSFVPSMTCQNDHAYSGWGVLVSVRANRPDRGLHLFPASAYWMPNRLRAEAAASGTSVAVLHSIGGRLEPFASFSDANAVALANQIDAAVGT